MLRSLRTSIALLGICLLSACAMAPAMAQDFGTYQLKPEQITEVYDGDTLYLNVPEWPAFAGQHIGVRLEGFDTPEMKSECPTADERAREHALAVQSKEVLKQALAGAKVIELRHLKRDKYFRILAELWLDGQPAADLLIGQHLAVPYHGEKKTGWCGLKAA